MLGDIHVFCYLPHRDQCDESAYHRANATGQVDISINMYVLTDLTLPSLRIS